MGGGGERICDIILPTADFQTKQGCASVFHFQSSSPPFFSFFFFLSLFFQKKEGGAETLRWPGSRSLWVCPVASSETAPQLHWWANRRVYQKCDSASRLCPTDPCASPASYRPLISSHPVLLCQDHWLKGKYQKDNDPVVTVLLECRFLTQDCGIHRFKPRVRELL